MSIDRDRTRGKRLVNHIFRNSFRQDMHAEQYFEPQAVDEPVEQSNTGSYQ